MNTRQLGYIILMLITITLAGVIGYGVHILLTPPHTAVIVFKQTGNLEIEDLVYYRGLPIAMVKSMDVVGQRIAVNIVFDKEFPIYANYHIFTSDKGIMGDRLIAIEPGDISCARIANGDTLYGEFFIGVSEVLGMAWKLEGAVQGMLSITERLKSGTEQSPSLIEQFNSIVATIDSFSVRLTKATIQADSDLKPQVRALNTALASVTKVSGTISRDGTKFLDSAGAQVGHLESLLPKLDAMVDTLGGFAQKLKQSETLMSTDAAAGLIDKISQLNALVSDMEQGTAKIRLLITRMK